MKRILRVFKPGNMLLLASFAALLAISTSCRKEPLPVAEATSPTKNLSAASDFNWKTTKEITLSVIGMKDVNPSIANTLNVNSVNGVNFYKCLLSMSQDYTFKFEVPATESSLILVYGSKTQTVAITSSSITFDYITQ